MGKKPGTVYLVGAGPGDVRLLTLRAKELIERADVVVYDKLLSAAILALIPQKAKKIDVGKVAGFHKVKQNEINAILVREALQHDCIVRLKGGDPFVFGRGGEELEELLEAGIGFEVVPGITSAVAASAYAGIPVTHRDFCSSVHIITAHKRSDRSETDGVDYDAIAKAGGTLVFLMGTAELPRIQEGLLAAGMDPQTPAAIIESGTMANQRRIGAVLGALRQKALEEDVKSPAIVLVGKVASLASNFDWRSKQQLFGVRVIVTRARQQAGRLAGMLREKGAEVLEAPALTIEEYDNADISSAIQNMESYQYVAFTSPNGVEATMAYLRAHELDIRALACVKIAAIGPGTREALAQYALRCDLMPDVYDAAHLGEAIAQRCQEGDRVLALRAQEGSLELNVALERAGLHFDDIAVYRSEAGVAHVDLIRNWVKEGPVTVALGSARCAQAFAAAVSDMDVSRIQAACIGQQTAAAAKQAGLKNISIAEKATLNDLVNCVIRLHHNFSE